MVGLKDIRECFAIFIVGCYLQIMYKCLCFHTEVDIMDSLAYRDITISRW